VVEQLSVVAVIFAKHLKWSSVSASVFPVELVIDFRMISVQRLAQRGKEAVDGLNGW